MGTKEHGFFYRCPGTDEAGREEQVLARIKSLKVPPAWEDARIARNPSAKVQAVGYDSACRLQYHEKYRERKEREKFERILDFAGRLPGCGASPATICGTRSWTGRKSSRACRA